MINYLSFLMILTLSECTELRSLATRSSYTTTYYGSGYSPSSFGSSGSSYRASNSYGYTGYNFNSAGNNFNYNFNTFSNSFSNSFARYQSTANQAVRTNSYFSNGKTYKPLTSYYLPQDYFNSKGYYSEVYTVTYYDGYGYNFFYGDFGYYEFSVNDPPQGEASASVAGIIISSVMFSCFICLTCFMFKDELGDSCGPCKDCCGGLCNIC